MLLTSKDIQPGVQVSVLIKHHLYSGWCTELGEERGAKKKELVLGWVFLGVFLVKYLVLKCSGAG